jgi:hypothetical protein
MKNTLADIYLDFINHWLSRERFAEHLDVSVTQCEDILTMGRQFHEERCTK